MQYTNVYTDEIAPSADFQAGFAASVGNIAELVQQLIFTSATTVFLSGLVPTAFATPGGAIQVSGGQAWQAGQSLAVPSTQTVNILSGSGTGTNGVWGTGLAADTTNPRLDLVIVQYTALATGSATRSFMDPSTETETPETVNTLTVDSYEWQVLHGTPSATPTAPAVPTGWIGVATVLVPANATTISASDITDLTSAYRISGGALGNMTGQAFYRVDSAFNTAPMFSFLNNTTVNLGTNTLADSSGQLTLTGNSGITLASPTTFTNSVVINSTGTLTNYGGYAGSPIVTSIAENVGYTVTNPVSPGPATLTLGNIPNSALTGNLITALNTTAQPGLTVSNPTGVGTATIALTAVGNSVLTGPLVTGLVGAEFTITNPTGVGTAQLTLQTVPTAVLSGVLVDSLTAGTGISVTNPTAIGAATVSAQDVPNSVLVGPLVTELTAGTGITVTNPSALGAATIAVQAIPNSALTGALVSTLAAANGSVVVTTPTAVGTGSVAVNPAYAMVWTALETFNAGAVISGPFTINGPVSGSAYGNAGGLATLDSAGYVPASQLGNVSEVLPESAVASPTALGVIETSAVTGATPVAYVTTDVRLNPLTFPLSYAWPFAC